MQRIRLGLAEAAVESARKWTFHTPSTGDLAEDEFWSARVPVDFSYRGDKKVAYGEWDAYLPGSRMHAPWLDEGEAAGNDALGGGDLQQIGAGTQLLTPLLEGRAGTTRCIGPAPSPTLRSRRMGARSRP